MDPALPQETVPVLLTCPHSDLSPTSVFADLPGAVSWGGGSDQLVLNLFLYPFLILQHMLLFTW